MTTSPHLLRQDAPDLITRIESGTGADEALDLAIIMAVMPDAVVRRADVDEAGKVIPGKAHDYTHWRLTSSLDAAIALTERLLPEADGWQFTIYHDGAQVSRRNFRDEPPVLEWGQSKSRPRALLAATLRAHAAKGDE